MNIDLRLGDSLEVLKTLPDNSVDSCVTDPPYGIGFMNKEWDKPSKHKELIDRETERSKERFEQGKSPVKGGFSKGVQPGLPIGGAKEGKWFQEWTEEWSKECLRVLKPGGYLLSFCAPRMYHRMATGIEDAGFQIRDQIMWIFGSGFPKSQNQGNGIGTALKPAHEPIVVARKPFKGTCKDNIEEWGTGGLNIDDCRIEYKDDKPIKTTTIREGGNSWNGEYKRTEDWEPNNTGRWPANIMFDEEPKEEWGKYFYYPKVSKKDRNEGMEQEVGTFFTRPRREDGSVIYKETHPEEWAEVMSKLTRKDKTAKAAAEEKLQNDNDGLKNTHPTVKPTELMLYLIKLVTPKGGTTMDCFLGSGSTGKAAIRGGFGFIGIEKEEEYYKIAQSRINYERNKGNN